ncbi:MFS-type transporter SLC18B1 [Brachionus plicatilis]|uniref:MFS-type transporter SLC18B1 n=1 Tax=Brachionus plicatilis TaxID=10195 RepID=A0A3M7T3W0_BRAPC|nr:MFS-type transporter SLC18B1 [Brachionus plicatilis]
MSHHTIDNALDQTRVKIVDSENKNPRRSSQNDEFVNQCKYVNFFGVQFQMNKTQFITIVLLMGYFFLSAAYYSLFAPFFPSEAINKHLSKTQIGIIFGMFELVIFILSPYFGKNLEHFGIRFLFVGGLFINSGSQFLFGFLDLCPDGIMFFIMCIVCRAVTGIGVSMGLSFAIVGHYFPDRISFFVSLLEIFNGLGFMIGPIIGGFLYQLGGFRLPFFVMGGFLFLLFIVALLFFPDVRDCTQPRENLSMIPFLKIPRLIITLLLVFMCALSIGFVQPSIELHLLPLNLSPIQIAFILMAPSLLYIVSTPLIGYLCDKYKNLMKWFMLFSTLIAAISFGLIAPMPILNLKFNLLTFMMGYLGFGLSIGGLAIPGYSELLRIATENGYANDLRTQGVISGLFSSIWSSGSLVGPIVGGFVVDKIGFELASTGIVFAFLISAVISIFFLIHDSCCIFTRNRYTDPLLPESAPLLTN